MGAPRPFRLPTEAPADNHPNTQVIDQKGNHPVKMLSFDEVMTRLGVSRVTLYHRIKEGRFHTVSKGTRKYFHNAEVEAEEKRISELNRGRIIPRGVASSAPASIDTRTARTVIPDAPKEKRPGSPPKAVEPEYDGGIAADAFQLFQENKGVRDVVIALRQSVALIEYLYEKWKKNGNEIHLSAAGITYLRERLGWVETPPTQEGLFKAINKMVEREVAREISAASQQAMTGAEIKQVNELERVEKRERPEAPETSVRDEMTAEEKKAIAEMEGTK